MLLESKYQLLNVPGVHKDAILKECGILHSILSNLDLLCLSELLLLLLLLLVHCNSKFCNNSNSNNTVVVDTFVAHTAAADIIAAAVAAAVAAVVAHAKGVGDCFLSVAWKDQWKFGRNEKLFSFSGELHQTLGRLLEPEEGLLSTQQKRPKECHQYRMSS